MFLTSWKKKREETLNKSITNDQIQKRHNKEIEKLAATQKKKIDSVYI